MSDLTDEQHSAIFLLTNALEDISYSRFDDAIDKLEDALRDLEKQRTREYFLDFICSGCGRTMREHNDERCPAETFSPASVTP